MSTQYGEEMPFEAKFTAFRDEIFNYGLSLDSIINIQKLLEILDPKIVDKQFGRDIVVSIHNYIDKALHPNFTVSQFFDACMKFRRGSLEKVETAQLQLSKLQSERAEAGEAINKARQEEQENSYGDKHNKVLNLEITGLQGLDIPNGRAIFVRLSCYNVRFVTAFKQYTEQVSWKDKFPFEVQTGFERVDATIVMSPLNPHGPEEVIGTAQVHVSSIKNLNYSNEWINLYNSWSLVPVGRVRLGLQMISSKVEYLDQIMQKLDEHITLQIEEIEGHERKLKGFNALLIPARSSYCQSPSAKMKGGLISPHRKNTSDCASNRGNNLSNDQCFRTILEEEDGESSANSSSLDMLQLPSMGINYNPTPNPVFQPIESSRDLQPASIPHKMVSSNIILPEKTPQKMVVYSQDGEIRSRSPFMPKQRPEIYAVPASTREIASVATNCSLETQSHSNSDSSKNILAASEGADKDAVINYLQKKLNEATRENEHLNNFIAGLTSENQKLKTEHEQLNNFIVRLTDENQRLRTENLKIEELQLQNHDYEDKICMLLEEIQKLDKLANRRLHESQDSRALRNALSNVLNTNNYDQNKQIFNENIKTIQTLPSKSKIEVTPWQDLPRAHSPFQSPRQAAPVKSSSNASMSRGQSYMTSSQIDLEKTKRVREPLKIFPDERTSSVKRGGIVRPAC